MALVVEDGTGLAAADAYISVADCVTYLDNHAASGSSNAFTASTDSALQEVAIRNATRFIDGNFFSRFRGYRKLGTQALQWPRDYARTFDGFDVPSTSVPDLVKNATCELALRFIANTTGHDTSRLSPDQAVTGAIRRKKVKAGKVEREVEYAGAAEETTMFSIVENLLGPLLLPEGRILLA